MSPSDTSERLRIPLLPTPVARPLLRPIPPTYDPGYPVELTGEQIQDLLRGGLFRRFSRPTLLTGAILAGALVAAGCGPGPAADGAASPHTKGPRPKPRQTAQVDKIVAEILGAYEKNAFWGPSASTLPKVELSGNPPVKYPHIPISFGNSYIGVFDTAGARAATLKLFAAYGLELVPGVSLKGEGYEFVADGFNPSTKVGFKIIVPDEMADVDAEAAVVDRSAPEHALSVSELKPLEAAVKAGDLNIFVVKAEGFPNMDGDLHTPMKYYLTSVIDYLNWLQGDLQIAR